MDLTEKVKKSIISMVNNIWLIFVPVLFDFTVYFVYLHIFHIKYVAPVKTFIFRLGTISAPPRINYILDNFPSCTISFNSNYGSMGIVNFISTLSILYLLSIVLVTSFFKGGYLGCMNNSENKKSTIIDFIKNGNRYWFRYFIIGLISLLPAVLMLISKSYIYLFVISVIFYYVQYSIVVDDCSFMDNFKRGISVFLKELNTTIRMAVYYGVLFTLTSPLIFYLSRSLYGMLFSIIIVDFFGMVINKAVMEIYRELEIKCSEEEANATSDN